MAAISIATPFNIDLEFNASPIVKRGLAYGIDLLVLFVYYLLYQFVIRRWVHMLPEGWAQVLELVIYYFPEVFYFFVMEVLLNGRSVGKIALGLRVVNINGGKAQLYPIPYPGLFSLGLPGAYRIGIPHHDLCLRHLHH